MTKTLFNVALILSLMGSALIYIATPDPLPEILQFALEQPILSHDKTVD